MEENKDILLIPPLEFKNKTINTFKEYVELVIETIGVDNENIEKRIVDDMMRFNNRMKYQFINDPRLKDTIEKFLNHDEMIKKLYMKYKDKFSLKVKIKWNEFLLQIAELGITNTIMKVDLKPVIDNIIEIGNFNLEEINSILEAKIEEYKTDIKQIFKEPDELAPQKEVTPVLEAKQASAPKESQKASNEKKPETNKQAKKQAETKKQADAMKQTEIEANQVEDAVNTSASRIVAEANEQANEQAKKDAAEKAAKTAEQAEKAAEEASKEAEDQSARIVIEAEEQATREAKEQATREEKEQAEEAARVSAEKARKQAEKASKIPDIFKGQDLYQQLNGYLRSNIKNYNIDEVIIPNLIEFFEDNQNNTFNKQTIKEAINNEFDGLIKYISGRAAAFSGIRSDESLGIYIKMFLKLYGLIIIYNKNYNSNNKANNEYIKKNLNNFKKENFKWEGSIRGYYKVSPILKKIKETINKVTEEIVEIPTWVTENGGYKKYLKYENAESNMPSLNFYRDKYIKYKNKYLQLKNFFIT